MSSICLVDVCGRFRGHYPVQWAADYEVQTGIVFFSGEWWDVPDWHCTAAPTGAEVYAYVSSHLPEFANVKI